MSRLFRYSYVSPIVTSFILCFVFSPALPWIYPWAPSSPLIAATPETKTDLMNTDLTFYQLASVTPVSKEKQVAEFNVEALEANVSMMPVNQQNSAGQAVSALPANSDSTITMGVGTAILIALLLVIFL